MNKLLITVSLAMSLSVSASNERNELCKDIGGLAKSIMQARQSGAPAHDLIEILGDDNESLRAIVIDAYSTPMFSTDEFKNREVTKFMNKWYLGCLGAK